MKNLTPVRTATKLDPKQLEKQRQKDKELVRGVFKDYECPGSTFSFVYGPMYKGDTTERWELTDGQIHTIPFGVARHLNRNCNYPEFEHNPADGFVGGSNPYHQANVRVSKRVQRVGFQSLEFLDNDDLTPTPTILTLETSL